MGNSAAISPPEKSVTLEEYFRLDNASPDKLEYDDGVIFNRSQGFPGSVGMAGGTENHSKICGNLMRELGNKLFDGPCTPHGSDLRVSVPNQPSFFYPDVTVICGESIYDPREDKRSVINPKLIIEVLSPGTEQDDRGRKFKRYLHLESLDEYVLVSQTEPSVEIFSRRDGGAWLFSYEVGLESVVKLASLNVEIALSGIFHKIVMPSSASAEGTSNQP